MRCRAARYCAIAGKACFEEPPKHRQQWRVCSIRQRGRAGKQPLRTVASVESAREVMPHPALPSLGTPAMPVCISPQTHPDLAGQAGLKAKGIEPMPERRENRTHGEILSQGAGSTHA